jgi:purine-binding chemotaxis protein CheW
MNLRGGVVPVLDLAMKFGLEESSITKRSCVVIVESAEGVVVGVLVDAVSQVLELPPQAIQPPPPFGTNVRASHILGIGKVDQRLVLLLDIDRVLFGEDVLPSVSTLPVEIPDPVPAPAAQAEDPSARARR